LQKRGELFVRTPNKTLSPRCASAIQIVRALRSTAETQSHVQPAFPQMFCSRSPLSKIALVLVRFDHVASVIVNIDRGIG
jgi:hypothetical protein